MAFHFLVIKYKDGRTETKTFKVSQNISSRELHLAELYCLTSELVESYKHFMGRNMTRDSETALNIVRRRLFDD